MFLELLFTCMSCDASPSHILAAKRSQKVGSSSPKAQWWHPPVRPWRMSETLAPRTRVLSTLAATVIIIIIIIIIITIIIIIIIIIITNLIVISIIIVIIIRLQGLMCLCLGAASVQAQCLFRRSVCFCLGAALEVWFLC